MKDCASSGSDSHSATAAATASDFDATPISDQKRQQGSASQSDSKARKITDMLLGWKS